jgi:hypothetical protein
MVATVGTFGLVSLCLIVANTSHKGQPAMLVELFPLVASAMAVLCFLAISADQSCE